jgi:hypothetical protein
MSRTAKVFGLIPFILTPAFSQTWSGVLVDGACYEREQRNTGPNNTEFDVNTDRDYDIRHCLPNAKTSSFSLVQPDGQSVKLNSAGNAKAAEITRNTAKRSRIHVTVTGEKQKNVVNVDSIAVDR